MSPAITHRKSPSIFPAIEPIQRKCLSPALAPARRLDLWSSPSARTLKAAARIASRLSKAGSLRREYRRQGIGASLIAAAEEWGRASRCTELASDTQTFNESSIAAHKALGFDEVERLVCFRKPL